MRLPRQEPRHRPPRLGFGARLRRPRSPPRAAARCPAPSVRGSGSPSAITTRATPGRDQQVGAGRAARRFMRARLERHIDSRAARRFARLGQRHRLGMRPPAGLGPAAADDPAVRTITQPTLGLGAVRPRPRSDSASAACHPARVGDQIPHDLSLSSIFLNCSWRSLRASSIAFLRACFFGAGRSSAARRSPRRCGQRPALHIDDVGLVFGLDMGIAREADDDHSRDQRAKGSAATFIALARNHERPEIAHGAKRRKAGEKCHRAKIGARRLGSQPPRAGARSTAPR